MKLFNRKAGNKTINYNGKQVKFVNCVADVDDSFGKEILKLGIPDVYENGKQPAFHTPKEVQMKSDFKDKEEWYQKEIARLTNISTSYKKKIDELTQEVTNWKAEYEKEREARMKLAESMSNPEALKPAEETPVMEEGEDEKLRKEFSSMKKDELIAFGQDSGVDMTSVADKTKAEIIDFLIKVTKE